MRKKKRQSHLTLTQVNRSIQDVRQVIIDRMESKGMSIYRLSKESGVTIQTVSKFVKGGSKSLRSDMLEKVLAVLGLEVRPKK